jgi:argininosuccinate lyase
LQGARLVEQLVARLEFDAAAMKAAISPDMFATDRALELVVSGVPFRDAYKQAAAEIPTRTAGDVDVDKSLEARVSLGGAGNVGLARLKQRLS